MIEKMIFDANKSMPLQIDEAIWDGTSFHIYGESWSFATLSAWRLSSFDKIVCGCYDENSYQIVSSLKGQFIQKIEFQETILKIDPVFILSNGLRLEIFSCDTYESWTFNINQLGIFIATPQSPESFDV